MTRSPLTLTETAGSQWQTIYCSLMLLLVVFFVMLIAYSAIDEGRFEQIGRIASKTAAGTVSKPDMGEAMRSMEQLPATSTEIDPLTIKKTADGFKAVIPTPVLFESGNASLNPAIIPTLDGIAAIAKKNNLIIEIQGHTDNMPIHTAAFPSNWELSTMRAVNILRHFQASGGLAADRLVAVGFSEYRPVADNDTQEGRRANRRIEIVFRPLP